MISKEYFPSLACDDQSLARLVERYLQEEVKADNGEAAAY
jgi:hypothetical protein